MRSEPTVSDEGALPGEEMPPKPGRPVALLMPLLPADETTRMPAFDAFCTACTSGSCAAGSYGGWPSDRLMMSMPSLPLLAVANSTAAIRLLVLPPPVRGEDLEPDERHAGRHAAIEPEREQAVTANQAGHMRAVPVVVIRRGRDAAAREVVERLDAPAEVERRRDAGVDHGHRDALAGRR